MMFISFFPVFVWFWFDPNEQAIHETNDLILGSDFFHFCWIFMRFRSPPLNPTIRNCIATQPINHTKRPITLRLAVTEMISIESQHRTPVEDQIKRDQLEQSSKIVIRSNQNCGWIQLGSG